MRYVLDIAPFFGIFHRHTRKKVHIIGKYYFASMTKSNKNNEKTNLDENQPDVPTLNANFIAHIIYTEIRTQVQKKLCTPHTLQNTHSSLLFDVNKKLKDFLR